MTRSLVAGIRCVRASGGQLPRSAALLGALVGLAWSAAAQAETRPRWSTAVADPRIVCGTTFAATSTADPTTVVLRAGYLGHPFSGTVRVYGRDRVWTANVSDGATATLRDLGRATAFIHHPIVEQSVVIHAGAPIEGVEFAPSWGTCVFHSGVRPRGPEDGPDVNAPVVVAGNPADVEPTSCARPYAASALAAGAPPLWPPIARQQGITGDVVVHVLVDENGTPSIMRVSISPSVLLNNAALDAVRRSSFSPSVFRCHAVPGWYEMVVAFPPR